MKNSVPSIIRSTLIAAALAIGVIASAPSAFAASAETIATVNVPFSFWMGNHELPAGAYRMLLRSNKMLQLNGPHGQTYMIMVHEAISSKTPRTGYILFHRYGETYFLDQVWSGETNIGVECSRTRAERQMVVASKRSTAGLTQIALNSQKQ
jgi:hypothetical protein